MNIFYLDQNPNKAAIYHVNKHVCKMIIESAQLLCNSHRILDNNHNNLFYRSTHLNHPCTRWVCLSKSNYSWLYDLFIALCEEYTYRYGRIHVTDSKFRDLLKHPPINIIDMGLTAPAQAMPKQYKNIDPVVAYRQYYVNEKFKFAVWSKREIPFWFEVNNNAHV